MATTNEIRLEGPLALELHELTGEKFRNISLSLMPGEILGIAGELGSGAEELAESIVGWRLPYAGNIIYGQIEHSHLSTARLRQQGIIFLPGDRKVDGLAFSRSVEENIASSVLLLCRRHGLVSRKLARLLTEEAASDASISLSLLDAEVSRLSGGQQQKVLLAKCLAARPKVLVALEPTRGVDVRSRMEIHKTLRFLCSDRKVAVLVVSSDTRELVEISDRILVMAAGQVVGEVDEPSRGEAHLIEAMSTGERARGHVAKWAYDNSSNVTEAQEEPGSPSAVSPNKTQTNVDGGADEFAQKKNGANLSEWMSHLRSAPWLPGVIGVLVMGIGLSFTSRFFLTAVNAEDLGRQIVILSLAGLGEMLVILVAGIDLSIGSVVTLTNLVSTVLLMREPTFFAIFASMLIGLVSGAICASLVLIGLPSFLATFAVGLIEGGLALLWFPHSVGPAPHSFWKLSSAKLGPVPTATVALVAIFIAASIVLRLTKPGIHLVAIGRDPVAARRNGLHVRSLIFGAYCASGLFAAAAGIFLTARVGGGLPGSGNDIPLDAIAAVMLGGASFFGGRVSVFGTLAGVSVLTLVGNGLDLLHVNAFLNDVVLGGVLLLIVGGMSLARRPKRGQRRF